MKIKIEEEYVRCECGSYYVKYDRNDSTCCDRCLTDYTSEHLLYLEKKGKSYIEMGKVHLKHYLVGDIDNYKVLELEECGAVLVSTLPKTED